MQEICVNVDDWEQLRERTIPISLSLAFQDDLTILNESAEISVGAFQTCFQVAANEDIFVEDDEVFTVVIDLSNSNDMVNINATLVIISDNDGEGVFNTHTGISVIV